MNIHRVIQNLKVCLNIKYGDPDPLITIVSSPINLPENFTRNFEIHSTDFYPPNKTYKFTNVKTRNLPSLKSLLALPLFVFAYKVHSFTKVDLLLWIFGWIALVIKKDDRLSLALTDNLLHI